MSAQTSIEPKLEENREPGIRVAGIPAPAGAGEGGGEILGRELGAGVGCMVLGRGFGRSIPPLTDGIGEAGSSDSGEETDWNDSFRSCLVLKADRYGGAVAG